MQAILFALIAYFAWGIGITFEAMAARKIDSKSFALWGCILGFLLASLYAPFATHELKHLTFGLIILCYIIAFFIYSGVIVYYEGLKRGNPSLVGTIGSSFPFVTVLLSFILLKETVTLFQSAAIFITIFGLILSLLNFDELKKKKVKFNEGVLYGLVTMVCWGIYATLIKIPIAKIGWFWPNWFIFSTFPLMFLFMRITKAKIEIPRKRNVIVLVILSILFVRTAEFAYNIGISKGLVSVVAPIAGANPTLFVILSYFIFKQRLKTYQILGIILTLTGIVGLAVTSYYKLSITP